MDYPKSLPGIGLVGGKFADANPTTGAPGSWIAAAWANSLMDELLGVINAAGLVPSEVDNGQVLLALKAIFVQAGAFTGSNQLKAQTGFQRLPGGLILQWGNSITAANGAVDVVFPTAFPSALYRSIINPIGDNFTVGRQNSAGVTGFNVNIVVASTGALTGASNTVGWYAIGV